MHIDIHDNTSLKEIRTVFQNFYPHLDIVFFGKPHGTYEASVDKDRLSYDLTVADIRKTHISGLISIQPTEKVADLEKEFQQRFGLPVQVMRKEYDHFEQTTGMDDFTLKDLNEFGRNSSDEFILTDDEEDLNSEAP